VDKPDPCSDARLPRDNTRRELIPQGQTGGLTIFEDHPNYWDAWGAYTVHIRRSEALLLTGSYGISDVEIHHLEKAQQLKFANVKAVASGPLLAAVETEVKYGKSTIKVTVSARRCAASSGAYQLT
jgi:alpha-mannosidase